VSNLHRLTHEFVEYIPERLEPGKLYISIQFATASHLCCCGCGLEVVTPFTPTDWTLSFDGESVSLNPSVGNWSFPCRSHYWIRRNTVRWAGAWSDEQIQLARNSDVSRKRRHFKPEDERVMDDGSPSLSTIVPAGGNQVRGVWARIRKLFCRK
jgi:hypothetical protein